MWIMTEKGWRRLWFTEAPDAPAYAGHAGAPGVAEWKKQERRKLLELWTQARRRGETDAR